jgi:hypothetical protein
MHVYKFLDERGGTPTREKLSFLSGDPSQARVEDRLSAEAQTARPRVEEEGSERGSGQGWHKRPPGWALRWEGSILTMIEE